MTELILVAIIGACGIVVGSLLTVFVTYMTTKAQNSSRTNELRLQLEHERKEKQITRLIERRVSYLNQISEYLQLIVESTHSIEKSLLTLTYCTGDENIIAWADSRARVSVDAVVKEVGSIAKYIEGIEKLRVKNNDNQLASQIKTTLSLGQRVSDGVHELHNMEIRHGEGEMGNNPNKEISFLCVKIGNATNEFFTAIRQTNRRIEEILCGME